MPLYYKRGAVMHLAWPDAGSTVQPHLATAPGADQSDDNNISYISWADRLACAELTSCVYLTGTWF